MRVNWHPIKSETDLPPIDGKDRWLTFDSPEGDKSVDKGWHTRIKGERGWIVDGSFFPWDDVDGEDRIVAWADYETPEPYEEEA